MSDAPPLAPPMTLSERVAKFLGDTARPLVLHAVGYAEAIAIVGGANEGVILAGGGILCTLFGVKGAEAIVEKVQIAKVQTAAVTADPSVAGTVAATAAATSSPAAANAVNTATATAASIAASAASTSAGAGPASGVTSTEGQATS